MPELPEVETIRRGLMKRIRSKRIRKIQIRRKQVVKMPPSEFTRALTGNAFTKIDRRGKLLIFHLKKNKKFMLVHLKMTGQLIYQAGGSLMGGGHPFDFAQGEPWPDCKYTRVVIHFVDGSRLFFNDLRVFGFLKVVDDNELTRVLARFGIEPFDPVKSLRDHGASFAKFTWENFVSVVRGRKASLKAVLLNQSLVAGLGNIYADEVAWLARVRPQRKVSSLTAAELKRIFQAIPNVLRAAIASGGTTFENYRDAEGKRGNYARHLKVYGRAGERCRRCKATLKRTVVAQRGTVYCPICQR